MRPPPPRPSHRATRLVRGFARWPVLGALAVLAALTGLVHISHSSNPELSARARAKSQDVYAAWYHVPEDSLAHRRADGQQFTAAHDKLPIGTLVRVTRLKNGRNVIVRITDRGIHNRRVALDLCQEAAEELDMIHKGIARVRMEVIPDQPGVSPLDSKTTAAQP